MPFADPELEAEARALATTELGVALIERFATLTRESGSADERAAAAHVVERLRELGVP